MGGDDQTTKQHARAREAAPPGAREGAPPGARRRARRPPAPGDVRAASFHVALRGYERREVDEYVERVNHVIAELEIARSPESAVRHALDRVGEQTSGILERARVTAEEIQATARAEADEAIEQAAAEAHSLVARANERATQIVSGAEAQALELRAAEERTVEELRARAEGETQALKAQIDELEHERRRAFDELSRLAARLGELSNRGGDADERALAAGETQSTAT